MIRLFANMIAGHIVLASLIIMIPVALVALGDSDAVPVGDYHLPHAIGYALEGTPRSSDERMLELLDPYRGQRTRRA